MPTVQVLAVFSITEPVGILLGWGLASTFEGRVGQIGAAILTALASGMFIYIAIVDILLHEFEGIRNSNSYVRFLLVGWHNATQLPGQITNNKKQKYNEIIGVSNITKAGGGYCTTMVFVFALGHWNACAVSSNGRKSISFECCQKKKKKKKKKKKNKKKKKKSLVWLIDITQVSVQPFLDFEDMNRKKLQQGCLLSLNPVFVGGVSLSNPHSVVCNGQIRSLSSINYCCYITHTVHKPHKAFCFSAVPLSGVHTPLPHVCLPTVYLEKACVHWGALSFWRNCCWR